MMKSRGVIVGVIVVLCLVVVLVSTLATEPMARAFESFNRPAVGGPPGFGGFPGLRTLGRFGPFGRHLGGWRGIASAIGSYFFLFLASALTLLVFPAPMRKIRDAFRGGLPHWLRLLGLGGLTGLALVLLAALGFFTSVVLPVPFVVVPVLLVIVWAGLVGLGLAIGRAITGPVASGRPSPIADLALGVLVMYAVARIPVAGWVLTVLLAAPALGAVVLTRLGTGGGWSLAAFDESM